MSHLLRYGAETAEDDSDVRGRRAGEEDVPDRVMNHVLALWTGMHQFIWQLKLVTQWQWSPVSPITAVAAALKLQLG